MCTYLTREGIRIPTFYRPQLKLKRVKAGMGRYMPLDQLE